MFDFTYHKPNSVPILPTAGGCKIEHPAEGGMSRRSSGRSIL